METIAGSVSLETSYVRVTAFKAKDIFEGPPSRPTGIQVDKLNILIKDETAHVSTVPGSLVDPKIVGLCNREVKRFLCLREVWSTDRGRLPRLTTTSGPGSDKPVELVYSGAPELC